MRRYTCSKVPSCIACVHQGISNVRPLPASCTSCAKLTFIFNQCILNTLSLTTYCHGLCRHQHHNVMLSASCPVTAQPCCSQAMQWGSHNTKCRQDQSWQMGAHIGADTAALGSRCIHCLRFQQHPSSSFLQEGFATVLYEQEDLALAPENNCAGLDRHLQEKQQGQKHTSRSASQPW